VVDAGARVGDRELALPICSRTGFVGGILPRFLHKVDWGTQGAAVLTIIFELFL